MVAARAAQRRAEPALVVIAARPFHHRRSPVGGQVGQYQGQTPSQGAGLQVGLQALNDVEMTMDRVERSR